MQNALCTKDLHIGHSVFLLHCFEITVSRVVVYLLANVHVITRSGLYQAFIFFKWYRKCPFSGGGVVWCDTVWFCISYVFLVNEHVIIRSGFYQVSNFFKWSRKCPFCLSGVVWWVSMRVGMVAGTTFPPPAWTGRRVQRPHSSCYVTFHSEPHDLHTDGWFFLQPSIDEARNDRAQGRAIK